MAVKKFILNADDFGMTKDYNRAVMYAYSRGFLKSASLCANGEAFDNAVNEVLPECPRLGVGVHLNIIEGKALTKLRNRGKRDKIKDRVIDTHNIVIERRNTHGFTHLQKNKRLRNRR